MSLVAAAPLLADTFQVDRFDDDNGSCVPGDCTLREALLAAEASPGLDTILLPAGVHALSIPSEGPGDLTRGSLSVLEHSVEIIAPEGAVVDAQGIDRVFAFFLSTGSRLVNLTITGGNPFGIGGGIYSEDSILDLENVWIVGNQSARGGGMAIELGSVTLNRSTISNNQSTTTGGGVYLFGISQTRVGRLELRNSTISGNHADQSGGAIRIGGEGQLLLEFSTIARNTNRPGDRTVTPFRTHPPAEAHYSIIEGSCLAGTTASCLFLASKAEEVAVEDLGLAPLASNGFRAPSHAALPGSAIIDVAPADATCPEIDQRGSPRPVDGDGDGEARCDAGAFEFEGLSTLEVPTMSTVTMLALILFLGGAGLVTLRL